MATTSNLLTLERLYTLSELSEAGHGDRRTITKLILEGRLPALKVSNGYKVRESDLHLLGQPAVVGVEVGSLSREPSLGEYVKALVDTFPGLNANQKAELGRLLAPAA